MAAQLATCHLPPTTYPLPLTTHNLSQGQGHLVLVPRLPVPQAVMAICLGKSLLKPGVHVTVAWEKTSKFFYRTELGAKSSELGVSSKVQ